MTLENVVDIIEYVSLHQPNVMQFGEGSVYDLNSNTSNKYSNIVITQREHNETEQTFIFNFVIFYVDRLVHNLKGNKLQVQSTGISVLSNILNTLEQEYDFDVLEKRYTTFQEKFVDECAGAYANVRIEVYKDMLCPELYEE